jgi:hypothetical protein
VAAIAQQARTKRSGAMASPVTTASAFVKGERERASTLVTEGVDHGPVAAYGKVVRGEVDAPLPVKLVTLQPLMKWIRTPIPQAASGAGAGIALVTSLLAVPIALLLATDAAAQAPLAIQIAVMGFVMAVTAAVCGVLYLLVLGKTRQQLIHRVERWSRSDKAYLMALIVIVPTVGFATLTAFGIHQHLLGLEGDHPRTKGLSFAAFTTYLWHLAHAVPFLDIPDTLKWKASLAFREWDGGNLLILAYKVALIVPLLQLFTLLLKRFFADQPAATSERSNTSR